MPQDVRKKSALFNNIQKNSSSEQHQLILDTLAIYDATTISIQEAISIVRTFTKTENQYCKAIYRFMLDLGFEQHAVDSVVELHLQHAIVNNYTEQQVQTHFSMLANLVMALLANNELSKPRLNDEQKQTILFALKSHNAKNVDFD